MYDLKVVDNDKDEITVMDGDKEVRGWSYANENERRAKMLGAREYVEGWYQGDGRPELAEICKELGCTTAPGVALRFAKELRRDLGRAYERHAELVKTWDTASPTERQELDRLRRGWGPSTHTERMARRGDLIAAMHSVEAAMTAVLPDDKGDDDLTLDHFQGAYDELTKAHRAIIELLQALPELSAPDLDSVALQPSTQIERRMSAEVYVYAVHNDKGELRAWVRDDPKFPADTARTVAEWITEGRAVQRMTWGQAHAAMPKPVS